MFSVFVDLKPFPDFNKILDGAALEAAGIVHGNIIEAIYSQGDADQPSGKTPEIDPIHLIGSFMVFTKSVIEAEVGSNIEDPRILENSINRPIIGAAIEKSKPEIVIAIEQKIEEKWL